MADDLTTEARAMAQITRLTEAQRKLLGWAARHGLQRGRTGYRTAFRVERARFQTAFVHRLIACGWLEKSGGIVRASPTGLALLGRGHARQIYGDLPPRQKPARLPYADN